MDARRARAGGASVIVEGETQARRIAAFLVSIGIPVEARDLDTPTLLPGVTIESGRVLYDPARLEWPGDLLHEAGHVAVTPATLRPALAGEVDVELAAHAGEAEATAWAYAAIVALGLDPAVLFHAGGYRGRSEGLVRTYSLGCYPGLAGLVAAGMALPPRAMPDGGPAGYPAMLRWLRE